MSTILKTFITILLLASTDSQITDEATLSPGENQYMKEIKRLVPEGQYKNCCLSPDEAWICWQGNTIGSGMGDQIWITPIIGGEPRMVSTAVGEAINPAFVPGKNRIIYSSTELFAPEQLDPAGLKPGLSWSLGDHDLYITDLEGTSQIRLTNTPGYDSEASVSPDGRTVVFTSVRDRDVDIYIMNIDGAGVKRLTDTFGFDCQPRFSPDGEWILFSSYTPITEDERKKYGDMLTNGIVAAPRFEIHRMRPDGSERQPITSLGAISLTPCMHPLNNKIFFSSNYDITLIGCSQDPMMFNLFSVDSNSSGLQQITFNPKFDGSPNFTKTGKNLIWISDRTTSPLVSTTGIYSAIWTARETSSQIAVPTTTTK